ncbi:phage structural protein [Pragia fontium]|uniref:DUF3277 family protein n=2 Tax=Pragia fontium TaxID=82985 RepID=A0AAJ4WAR4_9GAMM|nr:phage protein [Pragia fontium]AKJ42831.1 hypothetical protein QQ39_12700 [Pragia fontium]SFC86130.1 Protein of unknown function [Pragia fontium DSM 5563 = ATCC 49100]SUB83219.1 Uncharacterised protein [Pragia fontium]VEJ56114.1 Uncharacterised protein [Pragia fontium]GKX62283.1 hypothetical protein SOASR032_08520 [Pragia fontium]
MAVFDPQQTVVILNGVVMSDWADGSDVISATRATDMGAMTIGADGKGIFIREPNKSGTLALKIKQHSADNKQFSEWARQQENLKTFVPFTLEIRDLLNEDQVTATKGYLTTLPGYVRGAGHNAQTWTIVFEKMDFRFEKGYAN